MINYSSPQFTRIRSGSVLKEETEWQYLSDVSRGSWHTLVLGVHWSDTTDGAFRAWYDGKEVCTKKHVATTMKADDRPYQLRVGTKKPSCLLRMSWASRDATHPHSRTLGLYATDWHNHANAMKGSQTYVTITQITVSISNIFITSINAGKKLFISTKFPWVIRMKKLLQTFGNVVTNAIRFTVHHYFVHIYSPSNRFTL